MDRKKTDKQRSQENSARKTQLYLLLTRFGGRVSLAWLVFECPFTPPSCGTLTSMHTQFRRPGVREQRISRFVCPEASFLGLHVCVITGSSLCGLLCPNHLSSTPSCKDTDQIGLATPPMTSFYLDYLFKSPVSKCSHILRCTGD